MKYNSIYILIFWVATEKFACFDYIHFSNILELGTFLLELFKVWEFP